MVNGVQAATTTVGASNGDSAVDLTVFAYAVSPTQAFHFTIVAPRGAGLGGLEPMVRSFRPLSAAQAATVRPRYVRVVTVKKGETVETMAARMAFKDAQVDRFLTLNGLGSGATLKPGDRVKIVTY